jgi:hypothetical protein
LAKELKTIPASDPTQAANIIKKLCDQYDMKEDATRYQFHVSNANYSAYYDATEGVVKMQVIHPGVTEEQIKEFLINFPPFF